MRAAPGVWAIGDITGKGAFTHMSMYQADIVIADILGRADHAAEYHAVPRVTFTDPEIGAVGLTEAQARDAGLDVRTGATQVPDVGPRLDPQGRQRRLHQAGRGRASAACWSAPPRPGRWAARCWACWPWPCTPRCRSQRLREMIYAYPTFHRAIEAALDGLGPQARGRYPCDEARAPQATA